MIVGEAFQIAMNNRGVSIVNVNYQDMGNWAWKESVVQHKLHLHIFGRSENAKKQIFPEAVQLPPKGSGFYDNNKRLNAEDIVELKRQIEIISNKPKYNSENWKI